MQLDAVANASPEKGRERQKRFETWSLLDLCEVRDTSIVLSRGSGTQTVSFPSIASLDDRYGAAWRSGDRQNYSVRLEIIKEVDCLAAARNISEGDAVLLLDDERREKNWTLNMFSNEIRKRRH
ncbi:hypothetical protein V1515DRAFT_368853 [Lipomyces mesembrius]